jgi:hypothetical protein
MKTLLTSEAFADWLQHPVTEAVKKVLERKRRELKDAWESDEIQALTSQDWLLRNAANIGESRAYKRLGEMDFEALKGELEDD